MFFFGLLYFSPKFKAVSSTPPQALGSGWLAVLARAFLSVLPSDLEPSSLGSPSPGPSQVSPVYLEGRQVWQRLPPGCLPSTGKYCLLAAGGSCRGDWACRCASPFPPTLTSLPIPSFIPTRSCAGFGFGLVIGSVLLLTASLCELDFWGDRIPSSL